MGDRLAPLPDEFAATRDTLQRVAVHIVARARRQASGRFGLRVTPGGFGTPDFGDSTRVRVAGTSLVVERAPTGGATTDVAAIAGASLDDLASIVGVDLGAPLDVGHDTPPLGSTTDPLTVDRRGAESLAVWFDTTAVALDAVLATGSAGTPSVVQLWPEHFDVAVDVEAAPGRRVNLGGSPGDGFHADPYVYVGPWTDDRPGEGAFWNAPFGAVLGHAEIRRADDPIATVTSFLLDGVARLAH